MPCYPSVLELSTTDDLGSTTCFGGHVKNIAGKAYKNLGGIIRSVENTDAISNLYESLVRSVIEYGLPITSRILKLLKGFRQ